jgi:MFS family permease
MHDPDHGEPTRLTTDGIDRIPWRILIPGALAPNLFYGAGQGAVIPVIPIVALQIQNSYAAAAFVAAMLTIGQLLATLPAGWLVGRHGDRTSMIVAAGICVAGAICCLLAHNISLLTVGVALIGTAAAVYTMARHAWVTVAVSLSVRGRALSMVAGVNRFGLFVGPFLSAAVMAVFGQARLAFCVVILTSVALAAVVIFWPVPEDEVESARHAHADNDIARPGVFSTMKKRSGVLVRIGLPASILSTARTSRQIIIPLWGVELGIDSVHIAMIVGFCAAVDFALFYPGGHIIDRFGRLWVAIPSLVIFTLTNFVLAVSGHLPQPTAWLVGLATVMAFGSGLSAGAVGSMGSDLADQRSPAAFLSSWRLVTETGPSTAPLLISAVTSVISLTAAPVAMGLIGLVGLAALTRYVPRYLPPRPGGSLKR